MNRRIVIKNLALAIGGAVLLPSCVHKNGASYVQLKHIQLSEDQQNLVADITETIIPKTTTPGAKDLNLHLFVLKMLDDCYTKKDQQAFLAGLNEFNNLVKNKYNKVFSDLNVSERESLLTAIEQKMKPKEQPVMQQEQKSKPKDLNGRSQQLSTKEPKMPDAPPLFVFYKAIKQQTLFGYTTSKYFMTKQIVYELVPGRYNPHFPAKKPALI